MNSQTKKQLINQEMADEFMKPAKPRKFGKGGKKPAINKPDTHHGTLDLPNASLRKYSMAQGGSVGSYSKMEMEHVRQMEKHGVPDKYVKQERKEAMGMKKGGMTSCYSKGGGVESKAKTEGKVIRMASGGAVRGDGCISKGRTKGRMC